MTTFCVIGSSNDVIKPPVTRGAKLPEPEIDELSTRPNEKYKVHATGEIEKIMEEYLLDADDEEIMKHINPPKQKSGMKSEVKEEEDMEIKQESSDAESEEEEREDEDDENIASDEEESEVVEKPGKKRKGDFEEEFIKKLQKRMAYEAKTTKKDAKRAKKTMHEAEEEQAESEGEPEEDNLSYEPILKNKKAVKKVKEDRLPTFPQSKSNSAKTENKKTTKSKGKRAKKVK